MGGGKVEQGPISTAPNETGTEIRNRPRVAGRVVRRGLQPRTLRNSRAREIGTPGVGQEVAGGPLSRRTLRRFEARHQLGDLSGEIPAAPGRGVKLRVRDSGETPDFFNAIHGDVDCFQIEIHCGKTQDYQQMSALLTPLLATGPCRNP
jgi:hypothetical protein